MSNNSYYMHKEGLKTYNDLIKIFILLLCTSIRQYKEIDIAIVVKVHVCHHAIKLQFPLFLATVSIN